MTPAPDRTSALARLAAIVPAAGRHYGETRNHDDGPGADGWTRANVSQLSPWLHAGVISAPEVLEAVVARHGMQAAEKFIAEVFWRIYFKGYLEQRPSIWRDYCGGRDAALAAAAGDAELRSAYAQAIEGRTGIAAFDAWARELVRTGYLHNHARMWFASIWIFTLKLDWQLGADWFLRHLIDADAASNTLSWRWVAGLHTRGKHYLARADNIARYTAGRPGGALAAKGLAEDAAALQELAEHPRAPLDLPAPVQVADLAAPFALILHDEAAHHVPLALPAAPALVIGAARPSARSPGATGDPARRFAAEAVANGVAEAAALFGCPAAVWHEGEDLAAVIEAARIDRLAVPFLPTGWTRDALWPQLAPHAALGKLVPVLNDLDRATWPHAKAGYFGVARAIPELLREAGLDAS
jgi:hypothetical protein